MEFEREQVAILKRRLEEPPRTIQTLFGPRQSGKTTIVKQTLRTLAGPWRYYAVDSPDNDATSRQISQPTARRRSPAAPRDTNWLTEVWGLARADAAKHGGSVLVFDELQYIPDWSSTVKGLWDKDRWDELPLHVVILGSAPMSIQSSLNESMAGRFEVIDVRHWSFGEMKTAFGLELDQYVYFGGNPGAMRLTETWPPHWREYEPRWRRYVTTSLIEPAIEKDVLAMTRVDKPALIRRLFELGAAYSGQILPLHRMLGELQDAGNATTLARYLDLLSRIGLLTGLQKYSPSTLRIRNSPPKFNVLDTALMSVGSNRSFEDAKADRSFWGRLVESAVGAHLLNTCNPATRVLYWREASDEVDFVLQSGLRSVAIEVKTGSRVRSSRGMRIFKERFRPHRTLLVTESGEPHGSIPLKIFLSRPASAWFRSDFVQRNCTEIGERQGRDEASKPLSEFDSAPAYVLLGDPGMGKTTSFREACRNLGEQAQFISTRDFITLDAAHHREWRRKTLFIDGLDEIRAGSDDARTPLDDVRRQLDRLGQPRFRLSCREADWLGTNDRERLGAVAPDGKLKVLRLHPLADKEVVRIAESRFHLEDGRHFFDTAKQKGLGELIRNPQSLELLAAGVRAGEWPDNRVELFEFACRRLASEPNEEHSNAGVRRAAPNVLLETAGRICSLLLLSGTTGVRLSSTAKGTATGYKPADLIDPPPQAASPGDAEAWSRRQRAALSSRLFRAAAEPAPAERCFEPAHRHIAEFLAGRYLAQQIDDGLPAARVVSMVTAGDGGVVTEHRGLSAWLAAHSQPARSELIERDPLGVGLYGDIVGFSTDEKRALLLAAFQEARRLDSLLHGAAAFAPLASPALGAELREKLKATPETSVDQLSVEFLLRVLQHGGPVPTLVEPIRAILYAKGWRREVTWAALDAFIRQCADTAARTRELKDVLRDVQRRSLDDMHNELSATVLGELYPETIGPVEIWRHLARCQPTSAFGRHRYFWTHTINERTPDEDMATLLDALAKQRPDLALVDNGFGDGRAAAESLLARALELESDNLSPERLCAWLNAPARTDEEFHELRVSHDVSKAVSEHSDPTPPPSGETQEAWDSASGVRSWLEAHPGAYKAALLEGICRYTDEWDLKNRVVLANDYLRHAEPPPDFGFWCLEQAKENADDKPDLARWLFANACRRLEHGENGLSQQLIDEAASQRPSLKPATPSHGAANELREATRKDKTATDAFKEQQRRQEQEWLDVVRSEVPALERNRGAPGLLYRIATRWLQRFDDQPHNLLDWLKEELANEDDLAAAVATGLQGVLEREDLPDANEILRLHGENRMHYLSTPFLVALDERDLADSRFADGMTARQKRQACAFYLTVLIDRSVHPNWYRRLLEREVGLVADVLLPLARAELRRGTENVPHMWNLAHEDGHADLAGLVCLPLLRSFPVRCHERQLPNLIRLLWAALRYVDPDELIRIIEKKLAATSMMVNQRVHWLAAGVIADPYVYADRLSEFIDGRELRARQLARFLWSEHPAWFRPTRLPPHALEVLVRQSGAAYAVSDLAERPSHGDDNARGRRNAQPESVLWRIPDLIESLAASPDREAGEALRRLASDETLHRWRDQLREAGDRQAVISRDSFYRRPELDQVRATLDNLAPANAADLAALALHRIDEVARSIRHDNTNDWSQYWNQDGHGRPTDSKPENACRDALLSHLKQLLPAEVEAQPEGRYAADRRADIRLSCPGFHVPIEVKKQSHADLYRAARDQLVAKYAQDPATDGHGIFLALWFGDPEKTPLDDTATRPDSAEELQQRLEACLARQLSPQQLRKIAVRVIDVSKP